MTLAAKRVIREVQVGGEDQQWGVTTIQKYARGYLARRLYARMKARRKLEHRMAIQIQRVARGFIARLIFAMLWEEEMMRRRAVHCIQRAMRGHLARRHFRRMYIKATQAARLIARRWRGVAERRDPIHGAAAAPIGDHPAAQPAEAREQIRDEIQTKFDRQLCKYLIKQIKCTWKLPVGK